MRSANSSVRDWISHEMGVPHRPKLQRSLLALSVLLLVMLRRAEAEAPGDEYGECDSWVPMPHMVPMPHSSIKELLNSWRYQTLLSDSGSGVWTTYSESETSQQPLWSVTGTCVDSSVSVCSGTVDKVLETQIIRKDLPAPDTYPVRVFVNINYSTNCSTSMSDCETDVFLKVKDVENETVPEIMPESNLNKISSFHEKQFYFDLRPNETEQFQLLLVSPPNSGCITVSRIFVYRYECPGHERRPTGLVRRPSVQAPISGEVPSPFSSYCAGNSRRTQYDSSELLTCDAHGEWHNDQTSCQCDEGFYRDDTVCRVIITPVRGVYYVNESQGSVSVCFVLPEVTHGSFHILTQDSTALYNFDYVRVSTTVSFDQADGLSQCVNISIVNDELAEADESFFVRLFDESSVIISTTTVVIINNAGSAPCTEGSVTVRDADNSGLQLVEICNSEGVWSPPCDDYWSYEDITVICRELGYSLVDNWSFVGGTGNNKNINCSGTETHLIDCPVETLSYNSSCNYLLLKCRGYTLPTGGPTPIPTVPQTPVTTDSDTSLTGTQTTTDSGTSQTPVTSDSGTSQTGAKTTTASGPSQTPSTTDPGTSQTPVTAGSGTSQTSSQSTVSDVVSSPDITAPQSTSEDGPPLAALATAISLVAVVIIIVAVILLIALITYKRNKLNQQKHGERHLSNPTYDSSVLVKMKSEGEQTDKQEAEERTLYNPLYSQPNKAQSKHNGNGVNNSTLHHEDPEYSVPRVTTTTEYETPTISSSSISPSPPSPTPPHDYDYADIPPHTDPEYAPLEEVGSRQSLDAIEETPAYYHVLEQPEVTYHVLEPPLSEQSAPENTDDQRE